MSRYHQRIDFGTLRRLIEGAFLELGTFGNRVSVDSRINRLGEGMWHDNYVFWITGEDVPRKWKERTYVLRLLATSQDWQQGRNRQDQLLRESQTLCKLRELKFGHPTPELICLVRNGAENVGMIETLVPGYPLEQFKDVSSLHLIGKVAAAIHRLDPRHFDHVPQSSDSTQHVRQRLEELDTSLFHEFPIANEARDWIAARLPFTHEACMLHGDLLPQNLVFTINGANRADDCAGIVDWETARIGDPAYDLAIVSRGNRRILGVESGLGTLLEAYRNAGGAPISIAHVRVHETLLFLRWLQESWHESNQPGRGGHGPEQYEQRLRGLLRRAINAS